MTILIFLGVLVVLILAHEFGHFIVAKRAGIRVDEFGVGFPPKIFGKKLGETEYTLNWLPIGGFVRIWGEDPTEEQYEGPGKERSFVGKPRIIQAAVLVAGVTMNVLLAYVLFVAAFMIGIPTALDETLDADRLGDARIIITSIVPESPAIGMLRPNDQVIGLRSDKEVLDVRPLTPSMIADFIGAHGKTELTLDVIRRGEIVSLAVTPDLGVIPDDPDRAALGFSMTAIAMEQLPFVDALQAGFERTWYSLTDVALGLWSFIAQAVTGTADYDQIAGPVGIAGMVGDAASLGITWLMTFTAVISLNLAIINLLPIPALDGGRLLFVIIESITRRHIKPAVARAVNQIGFIVLLGLMALVTAGDIWKLFS